jgi:hypothetical protein
VIDLALYIVAPIVVVVACVTGAALVIGVVTVLARTMVVALPALVRWLIYAVICVAVALAPTFLIGWLAQTHPQMITWAVVPAAFIVLVVAIRYRLRQPK